MALGTPPISLAGFLTSLFTPLYDLLILTSSNVFNFHLWRLVTCQLVEPNPILFVWSIYCLYQFTSHIEPMWGPVETLKYFAIVQLITAGMIAWLAFMLFALFQLLNIFYY